MFFKDFGREVSHFALSDRGEAGPFGGEIQTSNPTKKAQMRKHYTATALTTKNVSFLPVRYHTFVIAFLMETAIVSAWCRVTLP